MDKYKKIREIGKGAFGAALLVQNKRTKEQCVVKIMNISRLSVEEKVDARKEVKVLSNLAHPNIVKYFESFEERGNLCIVMEFCDGGDLHDKIYPKPPNRGVLIEQQIWDLFVQICLAVKYLHDKHILHRDIKPANVFMTRKGDVKLGDFGISKELNHTQDLAMTFAGTPAYLAPEMCDGSAYNQKADIWSVGCILYEMAARKLPFDAHNIIHLGYKIRKERHLPLQPGYSREMQDMIDSLLAKNPRARPTLQEVLQKPVIKTIARRFITDRQHAEITQDKRQPLAPLQGNHPPQVPRAGLHANALKQALHNAPPFPVPLALQRPQPNIGIPYPFPDGHIYYPHQRRHYQPVQGIVYPGAIQRPAQFPVANQRPAVNVHIIPAGAHNPRQAPVIPDRAAKPNHLCELKDTFGMAFHRHREEFRQQLPLFNANQQPNGQAQIFDISRSRSPPVIPPRLPADHRLRRSDDDLDVLDVDNTLIGNHRGGAGNMRKNGGNSELYEDLLKYADVDIEEIQFEDVDPQQMRRSLELKAEALHTAGVDIPIEILQALPDIPCPPSPPPGGSSPPHRGSDWSPEFGHKTLVLDAAGRTEFNYDQDDIDPQQTLHTLGADIPIEILQASPYIPCPPSPPPGASAPTRSRDGSSGNESPSSASPDPGGHAKLIYHSDTSEEGDGNVAFIERREEEPEDRIREERPGTMRDELMAQDIMAKEIASIVKEDEKGYTNMSTLFGLPDQNQNKDLGLYDEMLALALHQREQEISEKELAALWD